MSTIESVLNETRVFPPPPECVAQANVSGMEAYRELYAKSEKDYEGFWGKIARDNLIWHKQFTKVLNETNAPFFTWYEDGELNVSYNCLDRHLESKPTRPPSSSRPTTARSPRSPTRSSTTGSAASPTA
jgi:acetyl-CoA synthetase